MFTYGDRVIDFNIERLLEFYNKNKKFAIIIAIQSSRRFVVLDIGYNFTANLFPKELKKDVG